MINVSTQDLILRITFSGITFSIKMSKTNSNIDGFKMFLSDENEATLFHGDKLNVFGVSLKTSVADMGYRIFKLKVFETLNHGKEHKKFQMKFKTDSVFA